MRLLFVCCLFFSRFRLPARIAELRAALALAYTDPAPYRPRLIIAGFTLSQPKSNYALPALGVLAIAALLAALWFGRTHTPTPPMSEGWAETTPFHLARRALAAVATETHVYVIGGMDNEDRYVAEVEYASILPDGRLGEWQYTEPLNEPRFYLAAAVANGYLYAIGGANGERGKDNIPSAVVEKARILPDGRLGPRQREHYLTTPRRGLQAVAFRKRLYAIGGYTGAFLNSIEHVEVHADGTLGEGREDPEHAVVDRYIHSATRRGDKLYLLGGHEQSAESVSYGDVEMAAIQTSGALSPLQIQKSVLGAPRGGAAAGAGGDYVYILGGHDGANRLPTVEVARADATGSGAAWHYAAPLKEGRSATAVAVHGDTVYVLCGMGGAGALNRVEMARQFDNGRLGRPLSR